MKRLVQSGRGSFLNHKENRGAHPQGSQGGGFRDWDKLLAASSASAGATTAVDLWGLEGSSTTDRVIVQIAKTLSGHELHDGQEVPDLDFKLADRAVLSNATPSSRPLLLLYPMATGAQIPLGISAVYATLSAAHNSEK